MRLMNRGNPRAVEQRLDGGRQGVLAAGETQAVGEVGVEFRAVSPRRWWRTTRRW